MKFEKTKLAGSYIIDIVPTPDERGWFGRTYDKIEFNTIGFTGEWVQMNQSYTAKAGSLRGMHYQLPPFAEIKLVRCIVGKIFDVIVDVRKNSDTFLQWFGTELSAENKKMLYIPKGFAHGFQTLTDNCELIYHHSQFYKPGFEGGIKYNDPMINIEWPDRVAHISKRDEGHTYLADNFEGINIS